MYNGSLRSPNNNNNNEVAREPDGMILYPTG